MLEFHESEVLLGLRALKRDPNWPFIDVGRLLNRVVRGFVGALEDASAYFYHSAPAVAPDLSELYRELQDLLLHISLLARQCQVYGLRGRGTRRCRYQADDQGFSDVAPGSH